jgi:sensor domain CHASE-containing protein
MNNLETLIDILFAGYIFTSIFAIYLAVKLARVQKEIDNIHEWADSVDEFMDSEYIELEIEEKK